MPSLALFCDLAKTVIARAAKQCGKSFQPRSQPPHQPCSRGWVGWRQPRERNKIAARQFSAFTVPPVI
jgi:hypothetical protein